MVHGCLGAVCQPLSFLISRGLGRYDMKLCLFIGVDSENKSIVLAQGFLSDEQITSFERVLKHFIIICGGHPEVSLAISFC